MRKTWVPEDAAPKRFDDRATALAPVKSYLKGVADECRARAAWLRDRGLESFTAATLAEYENERDLWG